MTQGRILLRTLIVQVFWETELFRVGVLVLQGLILKFSTLEGCGGPKRIDFFL